MITSFADPSQAIVEVLDRAITHSSVSLVPLRHHISRIAKALFTLMS